MTPCDLPNWVKAPVVISLYWGIGVTMGFQWGMHFEHFQRGKIWPWLRDCFRRNKLP